MMTLPSMRTLTCLVPFAALVLAGCSYSEIRPPAAQQDAKSGITERFGPMRFQEIAPGIWQHTSYLDVAGFGSVPSHGLLIVDGETSVLVDTAWTVDQTEALLEWASTRLAKPVRAAVVTHAHADKMGGMAALHAQNVETYAHGMSNAMAPAKDLLPARHALSFRDDGALAAATPAALGPLTIVYPGPGHTADNIALGINGTTIAFGGCLIKASTASSLGYLGESDTDRYADSVARFAAAFPGATRIAMSHSPVEGREAIARTLELAKELR